MLTLSDMLGPYGPTMNSPPNKETGCNKGNLMNEPFETTLFPIKQTILLNEAGC